MNIKFGHRPDPLANYPEYQLTLIKDRLPLIAGEVDLRPFSSPRRNQGSTGSCAAQATIKALEIKRIMKYGHEKHVPLSVLDMYYGARDLMDPKETDMDNGTHLTLCCEVLKRFGVCREAMFPFDPHQLFTPPTILATRESYLNKIVANYRIISTGEDRIQDVINNLQVGNPVVFGTRVGDNWMNYYNIKSDDNPLGPVSWEQGKGNHAICLVGWVNNRFIIENSWSTSWGDNGYGYLQPELIADDSSTDFWILCEGSELWAENK